jgi:TRAP-type C4-dicarboxylate transport system permease small subunit
MRRVLLKVLERTEEGITFFFFLVMCAFVFMQLFSRFVFNSPLVFTEEVSRFAYVWISFIGMSLATKTADHIRVDFFAGLLPRAVGTALGKTVNVVCLLILVYLAYLGIHFMAFSSMNVSGALKIPLNFVYASFPIGCLLSAFRLTRIMVSKGGA